MKTCPHPYNGPWIRRLMASGLVVLTCLGSCWAVPGRERSPSSPHHTARGFRNTNPTFRPPSFWTRTAYLLRRSWSTTWAPRSTHFPREDNDGQLLRENQTVPTVTWIGHSTLLVQLDGVNLLTDPIWSERASPVTWAGPKRVIAPGLSFDDLPPIDLVLISHDHYDHLDRQTVRRLWRRDDPVFAVPL